jgi:hypothetical protein
MLRVAIIGSRTYKPAHHIFSFVRDYLPPACTVGVMPREGVGRLAYKAAVNPTVFSSGEALLDWADVAVFFWDGLRGMTEDLLRVAVIRVWPDLDRCWLIQADAYEYRAIAIKAKLQRYVDEGLPQRRMLARIHEEASGDSDGDRPTRDGDDSGEADPSRVDPCPRGGPASR